MRMAWVGRGMEVEERVSMKKERVLSESTAMGLLAGVESFSRSAVSERKMDKSKPEGKIKIMLI